MLGEESREKRVGKETGLLTLSADLTQRFFDCSWMGFLIQHQRVNSKADYSKVK